MTKMPPHQNPPAYPKTHAEQMSAANKKHYEPLSWDNYFDELSYLDNVLYLLSKGNIYISSWPWRMPSFLHTWGRAFSLKFRMFSKIGETLCHTYRFRFQRAWSFKKSYKTWWHVDLILSNRNNINFKINHE